MTSIKIIGNDFTLGNTFKIHLIQSEVTPTNQQQYMLLNFKGMI